MSEGYYDAATPQVYRGLLPKRLETADITLEIRQQPGNALVMSPRNKRSRKPIDPAPVVKMTVSREADSTQLFLHNPHIFAMVALELEDGKNLPLSPLEGTTCASLMRLKDIDELGLWKPDCGFFIFPDLSISMQGTYRLRFHVYERRIDLFHWLKEAVSEPFEVLSQKDYTRPTESTLFIRSLAEQGVRIRTYRDRRSSAFAPQSEERGLDEIFTSSQGRNSISQVEDDLLSMSGVLNRSPDKRSGGARSDGDEDSDDCKRSPKRSKTKSAQLKHGINPTTRGWSAFSSTDLEENASQYRIFPIPATGAFHRQNLEQTLAHPASISLDSASGRQDTLVPSGAETVDLASFSDLYGFANDSQIDLSSRNRGHVRNISTQSTFSSSYSLTGVPNTHASQAYLSSSLQPLSRTFSDSFPTPVSQVWHHNAPFDINPNEFSRASALQTLANASQQHSYMAGPTVPLTSHSASNFRPDGLHPFESSSQQLPNHAQIPSAESIPRSNLNGSHFLIPGSQNVQSAYREHAAVLSWTEPVTAMTSSEHQEEGGNFGNV